MEVCTLHRPRWICLGKKISHSCYHVEIAQPGLDGGKEQYFDFITTVRCSMYLSPPSDPTTSRFPCCVLSYLSCNWQIQIWNQLRRAINYPTTHQFSSSSGYSFPGVEQASKYFPYWIKTTLLPTETKYFDDVQWWCRWIFRVQGKAQLKPAFMPLPSKWSSEYCFHWGQWSIVVRCTLAQPWMMSIVLWWAPPTTCVP